MAVQLGITVAFVIAMMAMPKESLTIFTNPVFIVLLLVTYFASFCALVCCNLHRKVPINYILLGVFTVCVSLIVGVTCAETEPKIVLEAATLTFAVVIGLTVYAMTTKTDFTFCGPLLYIFGTVFATAGIMAFLFGVDMGLGYSIIGVILFSFYLIYDTQLIIGGKHKKYQFDKDDYILGALALYLDIINLFLYILEILSSRS